MHACRSTLEDPTYLEDRIAFHEGRPQVWGTQFDWDDEGAMSPLAVADPDTLDARRAEINLPLLAEATEEHRRQLGREQPPADLAARRAAHHAWAVEVGWRRG